jgi:class 3 adenylate cyclase
VLSHHDELTAEETAKHDGRVVKSLGDGALLVFDRPAQAVACAMAIRRRAADAGVQLRAAVHTGECELVGEDIAGIAAHVASRLLAHATGDDIVVSGTVRDLTLGAGLPLELQDTVELRDVPGRWDVLVVRGSTVPAAVSSGGSPGERRPTKGGDAMTAFDRSLVSVTRRAPGLSRTVLRALERRRAPS